MVCELDGDFLARVNQILKVKTALNTLQLRKSADEVALGRDLGNKDFLKGMSHELHTPLHVIIGLCQLLERDHTTGLSPMQRDAIERMERNARSLLETVNHLLGCMRKGRVE